MSRRFEDFWLNECLKAVVNPSNYESYSYLKNPYYGGGLERKLIEKAYRLYRFFGIYPNVLVTPSIFYEYAGFRELQFSGYVNEIRKIAYLNPDYKDDDYILFFIKDEKNKYSLAYDFHSYDGEGFTTYDLSKNIYNPKTIRGKFFRRFLLHKGSINMKCNTGCLYHWEKY